MSVNTVQISQRQVPFNLRTTANGSYTLPQYVFMPHPSLQQLSGNIVLAPSLNGPPPATFAAPYQTQRPYPVADLPSIYGIRTLNVKSSP